MRTSYLDIRTLRRAAEIVGGEEELARRLSVPPSRLSAWLAGQAPLPEAMFLRAADILLEYEHAKLLGTATPGPEDAKDGR